MNRLSVVISDAVESFVDENSYSVFRWSEKQSGGQSCQDWKQASFVAGNPIKCAAEQPDDHQVYAEYEDGQNGINQAAVDDHVYVHSLVFEYGEGERDRNQQHEEIIHHLRNKRTTKHNLRESMQEDERKSPHRNAPEDPPDFSLVLLKVRSLVVSVQDQKAQKHVDHHIYSEIKIKGLVLLEQRQGIQRHRSPVEYLHQKYEHQTRQVHGIDQGFYLSWDLLLARKEYGEMEEQGRHESIGDYLERG